MLSRTRDLLAFYLGKLVCKISPKSTSLPGFLALKVSPKFTNKLLQKTQKDPIIITGTNGKSTTTGLVNHVLAYDKEELTVNNSLGANLSSGILTALLKEKFLSKKQPVLEVDEAFVRKITPSNKAKLILVSNFFRDQLDRFGEINTTISLVQEGLNLAKNGNLVLNADDPNVCKLNLQFSTNSNRQQVYYYGFLEEAFRSLESENQARSSGELGICPVCNHRLTYKRTWFGQMGEFFCQFCSFKKPNLNIYIRNFKFDYSNNYSKVTIGYQNIKEQNYKSGEIKLESSLLGLYNLYNILAASSACLVLGIAPKLIQERIKSYRPIFGRSQLIKYQDIEILVLLIKNPIGTEEVLKSVSWDRESPVLVLINDNYADGRDVSWLWDVDFRCLSEHQNSLICGGQRSSDLAVRLKYAGVKKINCYKYTDQAVQESIFKAKETSNKKLYILATYTALLDLKKKLKL